MGHSRHDGRALLPAGKHALLEELSLFNQTTTCRDYCQSFFRSSESKSRKLNAPDAAVADGWITAQEMRTETDAYVSVEFSSVHWLCERCRMARWKVAEERRTTRSSDTATGCETRAFLPSGRLSKGSTDSSKAFANSLAARRKPSVKLDEPCRGFGALITLRV